VDSSSCSNCNNQNHHERDVDVIPAGTTRNTQNFRDQDVAADVQDVKSTNTRENDLARPFKMLKTAFADFADARAGGSGGCA